MEIKEKIKYILDNEDKLIKVRKNETAKSFLKLLGIEYTTIDHNVIAVDVDVLTHEQIEAVKMIIEWKNI